MPTSLAGTVDRLIARVLLRGARRTWPALRLLPSSWLHPLLMPTAKRTRHLLARDVLRLSIAAGALIVLFATLR